MLLTKELGRAVTHFKRYTRTLSNMAGDCRLEYSLTKDGHSFVRVGDGAGF
jgi:hypothetical protein